MNTGFASFRAATCKASVTFRPTQLGALTDTLTFTDNASNSPQSVPVSGTGIVDAALTPASAMFAKTKVGATSAAKTLSVNQRSASSVDQHQSFNDWGHSRLFLHHKLRDEPASQEQVHDQCGVYARYNRQEDRSAKGE